MHSWALKAAQATACAQEQGNDYFWRLHDFLFENQREFTPEDVVARLRDQTKQFRGFDSGRFTACVNSKQTAANVDRDIAFGTQYGVTGTPTLFVNGERVTAGAAPPEQLRTLIREASNSASNRH